MDFWRFYQVITRRKWAILASVLLATGLTALGTSLLGREYEATASLMPNEGATAPASELARSTEEGLVAPDELRRRRLDTLIAVLRSPAVLGEVIAELELATTPAALSRRLQVTAETVDIIQVRVTHPDAELAASIINSLCERFVDFHSRLRVGELERHMSFLEDQLQQARQDLESRRETIHGFKNREQITSLPEQMRDSLSRMSALEAERASTQTRLEEVRARVREVFNEMARTPEVLHVPVVVDTVPEVTRVRGEIAELESELRALLARYTERHRDVQLARERLAAAEERLEQLETRARARTREEANPAWISLESNRVLLENERAGLMARLDQLNTELSQAHRAFSRYTGVDVRLASLTQEYNLADERYATLLSRWQQMQLAGDAVRQGTAIAIVDRAGPWNPPVDISRGRLLKFTLLAFLLSLCGAVAVVVGLDYVDHRLRSTADAEALVQLPVISVVPRAPLDWGPRELALCAEREPVSVVAESYRYLGLHVLQNARGRGASVLMAITARPGQGATATLANLAITLAQADQRVILVDADMRRPKVHRLFGLSNEVGLSDLLLDGLPPLDVIRETPVENLRVIPAGGCPENPWQVFRSRRMAGLVERLRQHADYVLFNTPSATVFADALSIASQMDGALLIMRAEQRPSGAEQQLKSWLEAAAVPVLGVVLNDMPAAEMESHRFHRYYTEHQAEEDWGEEPPAAALPGSGARGKGQA